MLGYSEPYILLMTFFALISVFQIFVKSSNTIQNICVLAVDLALILFLGFRGYILTDWAILYKDLYTTMPPLYKTTEIWHYITESTTEPIFLVYASICKCFSSEYQFFVLINFLTDLILIHIVFNRYLDKKYWAFFVVIFLGFNGFIFEANLMRNTKGLLLFLLSLKYIQERKFCKFLILNIIGLGFHWTSVFFIPTYFFIHLFLNRNTYAIILVSTIVLYFIAPYIFDFLGKTIADTIGGKVQERYLTYSGSGVYNKARGFGLGDIQRYAIAFLFLLLYNKMRKERYFYIFINAFCIYIMIAALGANFDIIRTRLSALFLFPIWFLCPQIVNCVTQKSKIILLLLLLMLPALKIYKSVHDDILWEYDNMLIGKHKSYEQRMIVFNENYEQLINR
ncbi:MAG: EpsG family protein [Bacteroidales bacterium]|nr:EpsG family protein [Bacteroidales bacterium]